MKNIHISPTDKPSRLIKIKDNLFYTTTENISSAIYQNIYITSDEEIKKGDWFITDDRRIEKCSFDWKAREWHKKIILTTDPKLIKDGVQAIDDEFLEWFVKNPSCEEVEVISERRNWKEINWITIYKIIIPKEVDMLELGQIVPKEEPKQNLEKEMFELEQELDIPSHLRWHNSKPKQETLEEIAIQKRNELGLKGTIDGFIAGAKWQQERMYSEEEVKELFFKLHRDCYYLQEPNQNVMEWFEQFKKK